MRKIFILIQLLLVAVILNAQEFNDNVSPRVKIANGVLEGLNESGIRVFKGIPFAQPPIGDLRWKEPQPVKNWEGVRKADKFGPRAMQRPIFSDMNFRSNGVSEDCLYLNVWTPAKSANNLLPVLVYFYGGGFIAGDGSEYRYDGESLARRGIVTVTVNYRLTVFGFLAHPELTRESPHHASGNYGLLDQNAALKWVQKNIAAFGGDPKKITIAGESAGSYSVSAQMASPLSKSIIAGAIGESGSLLGKQSTISLSEAEEVGSNFAKNAGAGSLAALRAMPAAQLLEATAQPGTRFPVDVDGYFLPESPVQIYKDGAQAHVPLLVGWNSEESSYGAIIGKQESTMENYQNAVKKLYGENADEILKVYHAADDQSVQQVATALASDRFIAFSTWKWSDVQSQTGGKPVYRYMYARPRPVMRSDTGDIAGSASHGASHSAEIEYALGNLPTNRVYDWQPEDYKVSEILQAYFANFIKTGNPNGTGVPAWKPVKSGGPAALMHIHVNTQFETEKTRDQYLLLDKISTK
ncbi:MAG: carboxylesterase family protein [Bacteroidota bacterium]|nr:carboxylesterase family protein [Bacteroidota bacterium]